MGTHLAKKKKEFIDTLMFLGSNIGQMEDLMDLILGLLRAEICYTIKRLLPADLKTYTSLRQDNIAFDDSNPFYDEFEMKKNEKFGGITVAPFFIYNRLVCETCSFLIR